MIVCAQAARGACGVQHAPGATTMFATSLWCTRAQHPQGQLAQQQQLVLGRWTWWARRLCCHQVLPASMTSTRCV
jgi:hypothetical protein